MLETAARQSLLPHSGHSNEVVRWIGERNLPAGGELLLRALSFPEELGTLSAHSWDKFIPLAKFTGLWSQIASCVRRLELEDRMPPEVRIHLRSAVMGAGGRETRIRWEIDRLKSALADTTCSIILLKGAAYLLLDFDFARGRRFSDVDLLVPKVSLPRVEAALRKHGWIHCEQRALHVEYFRTWLQEIAPMWHPDRKVQVDIHFTIIPPKDRIPFDPSSLFERAVLLGDGPFRVLAPADMFLHGTTNLFRTGEFTYLLRDLWDLREMLQRFNTQPGFWKDLVQRASDLRLQQTCYLALRYLQKVFGMPVPENVAAITNGWRPNSVFLAIVDACVRRCLFPRTLDQLDSGRNFVLWLREYWPLPRFRTYCSYLFWRKRLPSFRRIDDLDIVPDDHLPDRGREPTA